MHLAGVLATALTIFSLSSSQGTTSPSSSAAQAQVPTPPENSQTPPADQNPPVAQTDSPKTDPARKAQAKGNPRKHRAKPPAPAGEPRKVIVHQGGTSEPVAQIVPGITQEEANRQREYTGQLLAAADANLKRLAARTLTSNQQATTGQIRFYIDGARSALNDGDTRRAHTLAQKAYLLSDDLVKY